MTPDPRGAARAHPLTSRAPQSGKGTPRRLPAWGPRQRSRCAGFRPSLDGSRDGSPTRTPWWAGSGARRRGCAGKPAQALLGFRARDTCRARTAAHGSFEDAPAPVHAPRVRWWTGRGGCRRIADRRDLVPGDRVVCGDAEPRGCPGELGLRVDMGCSGSCYENANCGNISGWRECADNRAHTS